MQWMVLWLILVAGCRSTLPGNPINPNPPVVPSGKLGLLLPIYMWPTDKIPGSNQTYFQRLVEVKHKYPQVPIIAIINFVDSDLKSSNPEIVSILNQAVDLLRSANISVIAYATTNYTGEALAEVQGRINLWTARFPGKLSGIFVDEMEWQTGGGALEYYRSLYRFIKQSKGLSLVVNNPGGIVEEPYLDGSVADLINIFEGPPSSIKPGVWPPNPKQLGVLVYGASDWQGLLGAVGDKVSFVYFTNDTPGNPWDTLATYLEDLVAVLSQR